MRYTPQGTAVCSFSLATNRGWKTDSGERKEEAEFHRLVAWNKLAEICSQFLSKGRRCYVEGRLQTRQWTGQDGTSRQTTEIVIDEMILLDSRGVGEPDDLPTSAEAESTPDETVSTPEENSSPAKPVSKKKNEIKEVVSEVEPEATTEVDTDDIPF